MTQPDVRVVLDALLCSQARITSRLSDLRGESEHHATRCTAVAQKLLRARCRLDTTREEGVKIRLENRLLGEINTARNLLHGGEPSLRLSLTTLEAVATEVGVAGSTTAASALSQTTDALASALDREWRAFFASDEADALWQGARALALAPPGGLSAGLDGLERPRASLEHATALRETAQRIDALLARVGAVGADSATGSARLAVQGHERQRADCAARVTADLQTACRLAAQATGASADAADGSSVLLEAVSEAATAAAAAARAVASMFALLPPLSAASAAATDDGSVAAEVQTMTTATDALLAQLRAVPAPGDAGRSNALHELAGKTGALLRTQLDAAPTLANAGQSTRGRRALSMLGEAGERLGSAAVAQARSGGFS
jgi:hypothetical protein